MYSRNEDISKLIPRLLTDNDHPHLKNISDIEECYTFEANGVNVDYILLLKHKIDSDYKTEQHPINKLYEDVFNKIKAFSSSDTTEDFDDITKYIKNTELIPVSQQLASQSDQGFFYYCINLADRYIPKIYFDIEDKLDRVIELRFILDGVYVSNEYDIQNKKYENEYQKTEDIKRLEKNYLGSKTELKKEVCNYIALWIHAYRFLQARKELSNQKNIISYSHRYQGWSKPRYKVNDELTIEFITNFGYGNSSYFYLLLIYRGIQIFPFMEWVNYKYAAASEMEKYTERYHKEEIVKIHRSKDPKYQSKPNEPSTRKVLTIEQEYWNNAFNDLVKACNIYEKGTHTFIENYITSALDSLIKALEDIFEMGENTSDKKYRDFGYDFDINYKTEGYVKRIKLMSVKGAMISGTLGFMGQIIELEEIIDTKVYIQKITSLNNRVLPLLQATIPDCQNLIYELGQRVETLKSDLVNIWIHKGLKEYTQAYVSNKLNEQDIEKYKKLKKEHGKISERKNIAEQDLKHSINILKSIERYINNIEKYFSLTR
jgi:hypothetical protein